MDSQQELINKADIALSDLSGSGGLLNPEQSNRFIRTLIDQPTILNEARVVPMSGPTLNLNKIGFGSRMLQAATQTAGSRELAIGDRTKPDLSQVNLTTSEVIAEIRLPYEVLEDNIERGNMTNTILTLIAERAALDLEELIISGDSISGDPFLALQDGVLKLITTNTVDGTGLGVATTLWDPTIKAMPTQYRRNKNLMRIFTSHDVEQDYRVSLAARETGLGDSVIMGNQPLGIFGVPTKGIALMPDTDAVFCNPQNIIVGIQRKILIESEKDISAREWKIVMTARVAVELEEETACVKTYDINTV
jgi:HK97 family phage major capsid protein